MSVDQLEHVRNALAGRYAIERELGSGGMATVYLADDPKHDRKVAVKVFREEVASAVGADRFTREIQIAAKLSYPHILPLFDSGEANGLLFYAMPYVAGESLRQKLKREQQVAIPEAVSIVRQVASALEYAHARGLIHRDISPENILLHEGEAIRRGALRVSVPPSVRARWPSENTTRRWICSSAHTMSEPARSTT